MRAGHRLDKVRLCPACEHTHAVGTTCRECPTCRETDPVLVAERVFADLLPGGADAHAALVRHNRNLGLGAACGGSCGLAGCRRPYFDHAGLTRYRDGSAPIERMRPTSTELLDIPIEEDYPRSAWEVD